MTDTLADADTDDPDTDESTTAAPAWKDNVFPTFLLIAAAAAPAAAAAETKYIL